MAKKNDIQIIITAVDKASKEIKQVNNALEGLKIGAAVAGAAFVASITAVSAAAYKLAKDAIPSEGIRNAFVELTADIEGGSQTMIKAMETSSYGMINQTDLMKSFNAASQLVSKDFARNLPEAMKYLAKVSAATGQDMGTMLNSLVTGVGRLSPMILDNLGIQVDLTMATERAAQIFGVATDALTKEQIQAGMTNVVLEKLKQNTASMPEVMGTAGQAFAELNAKMANMKDEIGLKLLPLFQTVASKIVELWQKPEIQESINKFLGWIGNVIGDENSGLIGVITTLSEGGIAGLIKDAFGIEPNGKLIEVIDKILNLEPGTADSFFSKFYESVMKYLGPDGDIGREMINFGNRVNEDAAKWGLVYQAIQTNNFEAAGAAINAIFSQWSDDFNKKWGGWITDIWNKFQNVQWDQLGVDMITKIANGMISAWQWFIGKVVTPFTQLISGMTTGQTPKAPVYKPSGGHSPFSGFSQGGSFIVPGMGSGDRPYTLGLTPGETVTVTPSGRSANAGPSLSVHIHSVVNLADRNYAERELMPYIETGVRQLMARGA